MIMKDLKPILVCSSGHVYNPNSISERWWKGEREEGGKCPEVLSYDVMQRPKTKRCNRKLFKLNQTNK